MYELFNVYGECDIRILMDKFKGTPKGIAFVEYATVSNMKKAIGKLIKPVWGPFYETNIPFFGMDT